MCPFLLPNGLHFQIKRGHVNITHLKDTTLIIDQILPSLKLILTNFVLSFIDVFFLQLSFIIYIFYYLHLPYGGPDNDMWGPQGNEIMDPLNLTPPVLNIFYSRYILVTFTQLEVNLLYIPKLEGPQAEAYTNLLDNPALALWRRGCIEKLGIS